MRLGSVCVDSVCVVCVVCVVCEVCVVCVVCVVCIVCVACLVLCVCFVCAAQRVNARLHDVLFPRHFFEQLAVELPHKLAHRGIPSAGK